ncbi:hypothetical protein DIURU_004514 [Diutina rugosa]|uniref:Uncharacterized protein n=1 Tax=Diutina rugosa TaxID=5481 RepID=A0A642UGZ8_DIURU|nr:uncharacterized protein DIURU_004514 [Diutina rugosa]KAA8898894.1 hypothetical protein DIURU_004514 [Diutina rugosa]
MSAYSIFTDPHHLIDTHHLASVKIGMTTESGDVDTRINHYPKVDEAVYHLKLIKAFLALKQRILKHSENPALDWRRYLQLASRRYLAFVSALRNYLDKEPRLTPMDERRAYESGLNFSGNQLAKLDSFYPPLDVLLVWYSFMMNPTSFYDNFVIGKFVRMIFYPFPLRRVCDAIDNHTFGYSPSIDACYAYVDLLYSYSNDPTDLHYHTTLASINEVKMHVRCPLCTQVLVTDISLTNEDGTGFSDTGFCIEQNANSKCNCPFNRTLTHEELRKRVLFKYLDDKIFFMGITKYYSKLFHASKGSLDGRIRASIKKSGVSTVDSFRVLTMDKIIDHAKMDAISRRENDLVQIIDQILGVYRRYDLTFLTLPKSIHQWENLPDLVLKQEPFMEQVAAQGWTESIYCKEILTESAIRYMQFYSLGIDKSNRETVLVPTLDIDLFYRTHHLSLLYYLQLSKTTTRWMLEPQDVSPGFDLTQWFQTTALKFRNRFQQQYQICYCDQCVSSRHNMQRQDEVSGVVAPPPYSTVDPIEANMPASLDPSKQVRSNKLKHAIAFLNRRSPTQDTGPACSLEYNRMVGPSPRAVTMNLGDRSYLKSSYPIKQFYDAY